MLDCGNEPNGSRSLALYLEPLQQYALLVLALALDVGLVCNWRILHGRIQGTRI